MIRSLAALLLLVLLVASLWYSQAPPRTEGAYRDEAVQTLGYLTSQVNTARIWARELDQQDTTLPAASVAFREVETDAQATASRFAGYDPPRGMDGMHGRVTTLGDDVVSALARLRIAAHRSDVRAVVQSSRSLHRLARDLEKAMRGVAR